MPAISSNKDQQQQAQKGQNKKEFEPISISSLVEDSDRNNNLGSGSGMGVVPGINSSNGNVSSSNHPGNDYSDDRTSLPEQRSSIDECLDLFKACCKKKANFGLEDIFWIVFLLIILTFSILKGLTKYSWSQITYMMIGCIGILLLIYVGATIFNKFVLEDSSTAHWNAHARYTQAAIQSRLNDEEQRVHVIAPPKMGGAKLNIIYSVGDVPLSKTASSGSSSTLNGSRQGSIGSGIGVPNAFTNLTQQTINTAAAFLTSANTGTSAPNSTPASTATTTTATCQNSQISTITSTGTPVYSSSTTSTIKSSNQTPSSLSHHHLAHHTHQHVQHSNPTIRSSMTKLQHQSGLDLSPLSSAALLSSLKNDVIAEEEDRPETPSINNSLQKND